MSNRARAALHAVAVVLVVVLGGCISTSGSAAPPGPPPAPPPNFDIAGADLLALQRGMDASQVTSRQVVQFYLDRVTALNQRGPGLNALRRVEPDVFAQADRLDAERRAGGARGPLHGVPVLLKDNIDVAGVPTTAGSVALGGSVPPDDAFLVLQLRAAGAVIFGKANMTEFANFMALGMPNGYSSGGGQVLNPYDLIADPCGSSTGSAVAAAASLTAVAVGTETDGSILCPSSFSSTVGVKPTVGLISRAGILPIAHSQDTAGPITRTVSDAAALLGAMTGVDAEDPATRASADRAETDYTRFLTRGSLRGARIGIPRQYFDGVRPTRLPAVEAAVDRLRQLGATVVDPVEVDSFAELSATGFDVLFYEFKRDLNRYFDTLGPGAEVDSLGDVIAFNNANVGQALKYGQELLTLSEGDRGADGEVISATEYRQLRARDLRLSRREGIDATLRRHRLDAVLFPEAAGAAISAKAGYPSVGVPAGYTADGRFPVGVTFLGRAWAEGPLLGYAYDFEQTTVARRSPELANPAAFRCTPWSPPAPPAQAPVQQPAACPPAA